MIDIQTENLLPLRDVPKLLPLRPNGKRLHISAVYRWVQRGVRGVRLEAVRIGGTTYTSHEALARFGAPVGDHNAPQLESPAARSKRAERARREVERLLYPNRNDKPKRRRAAS